MLDVNWSLQHIPGTEQRADILTKDICVADIFLTHQPKVLGTRF